MKLKDFLSNLDSDVDVYVDGTGFGIAVCPEVRFTDEGLKEFEDVLELEVEYCCIVGEDKDYEDFDLCNEEGIGDGGRLEKACYLLSALAGYCSCSNHEKWFGK